MLKPIDQGIPMERLFRPGGVTPMEPGSQQAAAVNQGESTAFGKGESCETCDSRKYKDRSDDPSVSFQSPTHISPEQASVKVRAHEHEHVRNEKAQAQREGREVLYQTVVLHGGICPDCGKPYVAGGETRTVTRGSISAEDLKGQVVDTYI
ncbi:hypothetical protein [Anoxynatronum buryatiense]|uniref:Uncharacterized protein n=1 Tax=Anoxynatronum buryatiense TaxID=489973 RepID=A0AA45WWN3_9CLOT|nr:hypothetical protein [Anoxynatronum buryatiense]SMP60421.1 hypothetical protein SAMN06296020_108131 [Anoxynatronum buryatiense]